MASVPSKSEIQNGAGKIARKAEETARETVQSSETHLDGTGDAQGDLYAKGKNSAGDLLSEMPANLSDIAAAGERIVLRGRQSLDHGVRKQPVEALLLAGAIGYLVGWAASRG